MRKITLPMLISGPAFGVTIGFLLTETGSDALGWVALLFTCIGAYNSLAAMISDGDPQLKHQMLLSLLYRARQENPKTTVHQFLSRLEQVKKGLRK